jgi:uncharacterized protein (DUF342 family)
VVDFVQLQQIVKERLEQDRTVRMVNAGGDTLEIAVAEAATLLDLPVRRIEYEITERGFPGFLGMGKKEWKIQAYAGAKARKDQDAESAAVAQEAAAEAVQAVADQDGAAFVHLSSEGAFIKIKAPIGNGKKINEKEVRKLLESRRVLEYDQEIFAKAVKDAAGEYVRVGDFARMPGNDSMMTVEIGDSEMKAWITVTPPGPGGCDLSFETYMNYLENYRISYGVNEEFIRDFADQPLYKEKVLVAEGAKPIDGRDAYIEYNFETDQTKVHLKEGSNGKVDFKDLNIIQNVVANQPLARKIPPEQGIVGRTVTGKPIIAKNGKDIPLPTGKNVHAGEDGVTIFADINGQVVLAGQNINVEPVYTVDGDVNLKTGNIIFLGTVYIKGNVEDGFSVKAAGNIEITGTVEKADLDAEGDIIVHQGITGKHSGLIRAGRSIWARYIENAILEAGNMVIASDGIINSEVDAFKRIVCQGKRAHIVGGRLRTTEEINAKILGNPTSGTETICEVGIDPKIKEQIESMSVQKISIDRQLKSCQKDVRTLMSIKQQRKSLPEDKEAYLNELNTKNQELVREMRRINEEMKKLQDYLDGLTIRSKVSASAKVYPGVKVIIRDAINDIHTEYKAVTFIMENGLVRVTRYEEPDESAKKGPDGFTTD